MEKGMKSANAELDDKVDLICVKNNITKLKFN